ncbi:putative cbiG [Burkholderia thailandensis E444]|nr:putative cbiG [Burkholderia thailandensis E444]
MQPWTTRRLPAALNPGAARRRAAHARDRRTTPVSRPVSGLTKTPLHLPGRDASSGWPRMPSGTRRSRRRTACAMPSLTVAGAAQVGEPRCGGAPCFPFDCVRQKPHASTETRASVGRADAARQGGQKVPPRLRRGAAARDRRGPRGEAARQAARSGAVLSYARVRCPGAHSRARANGKQEAASPRSLCCPRNGTPPATRADARRASRLRATVLTDGKAAGWQAVSPDTGRRTGRAALAERRVFRGRRKRARHPRNRCHSTTGRQPAVDRRNRMTSSDSRSRNPRERDARAARR